MVEHINTREISLSGYSAGCRCEGCVEAKRLWHQEYEKRKYFARRDRITVDAAPIRRHIQWLMHNGVGYRRLVELSTVPLTEQHLYRIASGRTKRVQPATANAVLAVDRCDVADTATVDAALTWRRLRGLMARGYSSTFIAGELGLNNSRGTLPIARTRTTAKNARAVIALCHKYGATIGPSERSRRLAAKRGWEAYGEWDDDLTELSAITPLACKQCAKSFIPSRFGRRPDYCSEPCRHAAGHARTKELKSA